MVDVGYVKVSVEDAYYIYDTSTNDLVKVDKAVYQIIDDYFDYGPGCLEEKHGDCLSHEQLATAVEAISHMTESRGMFQPFVPIDYACYLNTDYLSSLLSHSLQQLTLGVTEQCNLRCEYCVYSGHYEGRRTHNSQFMTWQTARKSIDYFLARADTERRPAIIFYGGEPLLGKRLVQQCVEYVGEQYPWANPIFAMATNATLCTDAALDFFIQNQFKLFISLDGPPAVHDAAQRPTRRNRHSHKSAGHAARIRQKDPEYLQKNVVIQPTFNENGDILEIYQYFSEGFFSDLQVRCRTMRDQDTNAYIVPESSHEAHKKRLGELVDMYLTSLQDGTPYNNSFLHHVLPRVFDYLAKRDTGHAPAAHRPNNTCVPGKTQLFVSSQGEFYMCNNVCGPGLQIGNCDDGIDVTKVQNLLKSYVRFCDEMCQNCWAYRLCSQCFTQVLEKGRISKRRKLDNCRRERKEITKALEQYIRIWEHEPESTWDNGDSLHAIVSQCNSSPACTKCQAVTKNVRVQQLTGDPMVGGEEIRHALKGKTKLAQCTQSNDASTA